MTTVRIVTLLTELLADFHPDDIPLSQASDVFAQSFNLADRSR